jgi:hypothetical protein
MSVIKIEKQYNVIKKGKGVIFTGTREELIHYLLILKSRNA